MHHVILAVVEAETVPSWMLATVAGIEILVGVARKITKTLNLILHSMAVDNVHNHRNTVLVGGVDKLFQFLWCAETA